MSNDMHSGYAASHPVIRLSSKRWSFSPYASCYSRPDIVWGLYSGRFYALGWGDDALATYRVLRQAAVLFDVPERPIEIAGPDCMKFVQRVFCRRLDDLAVGRGRYALACRQDGGILMDGILFRLAADMLWYVPANGEFRPWLEALAIGFDVALRDPQSWVLQVQGPKSLDVLAAIWSEAEARALPYFHIRRCEVAGQPMLVSRTGWTGELGFELFSLGAFDGPALWRHVLARGEPFGLVAGSLESMGMRRIEAGILDNGTDMDPSLTPYGAGLGKFVDLEARDYVGRAALSKADKRSLIFGLTAVNGAPVAGMGVLMDGRVVGTVTTGTFSPHLGHGIGYVRFNEPGEWLGASVALPEAGAGEAKVVALPFLDPERRLPRQLAIST